MHPRAAAQTPKPAPARRGGLDLPSHTTNSRRIRLVDPLDRDAPSRRLLGQIACELPMRPLTDLLVGLLAQAHPVWMSRTSPTAIRATFSSTQNSTTLRAA